jgi:release factor glutamine methyltransferase
VDKNTLIPRQETEELVDLIIRENRGITGKIIDLGTGSGCIAIALSKNLPGADIYASDNSAAAIRMAENNARINHVSIQFFTHDILKPYTGKIPDVKIIVSNPPYVTESEKKNMHMNILDFEPPGALFVPDNDPLIFYRSILEISQSRLLPYGKVYFEINESKGQEMVSLMKSKGFVDVSIIKDLNGKDRIIKAKLNG